GALTKLGAGTLTLTNANTYTGATTVNNGTLLLDFNAAGAPASNIVSSSSALSLGGGTLSVNGNAGTTVSQTFASTALALGNSTVTATSNGGQAVNVNLGAITLSAAGATSVYNLPANGQIQTTTGAAGGVI